MSVVVLLLTGCHHDWRIEPCVGEGPDQCQVETIEVGEPRTYVVSSRDACPKKGRPLVLWFHGSGGNGASDRAQVNTTWEDLALEATFAGEALFVYPDGLPHRDCRGATCWDRDPEGRDVALFDALVPRLAAEQCADPSRVLAFGHSRGGRFVEVLACHRAPQLLGAAMIAAGPDNVASCPGALPIWLSHGLDDRTIDFSAGEGHRDAWAARNDCASPGNDWPLDACSPLPGCPADTPVTWCPTTEGDWSGHAVPGLADEELRAFFDGLAAP